MGDDVTTGLIPSPKERREQMRSQMVNAILEAARDVMRERGVAALSLREVARRVRLQAPSLYAYFPSKAALYDALYLMGIRRFRGFKDRSGPGSPSFWDQLFASFATYMQFAQEHPDLYQLAFERPVPGFSPSEESMKESRQLLGGLEQVLEPAIEEGEIRPNLSISQARDLIVAMSHGLTSQHMANEPDLPIGSGRYGSLIPAAVDVFRKAWEPNRPVDEGRLRDAGTQPGTHPEKEKEERS
jgi:AcrR family transcriptional regulator